MSFTRYCIGNGLSNTALLIIIGNKLETKLIVTERDMKYNLAMLISGMKLNTIDIATHIVITILDSINYMCHFGVYKYFMMYHCLIACDVLNAISWDEKQFLFRVLYHGVFLYSIHFLLLFFCRCIVVLRSFIIVFESCMLCIGINVQ